MCQDELSGLEIPRILRLIVILVISKYKRSHPFGWLLHNRFSQVIDSYKITLKGKGSVPWWEIIPQDRQTS